MTECLVCSPEYRPKKRDFKPRRRSGEATLDINVRRQIAAEFGDDEPTKDEKFQMLQKYGVAAPRIDRQITKPSWQETSVWKRKSNDFFQATRGLVQPQQQKRTTPRPQTVSRPSYNSTRTATRPR